MDLANDPLAVQHGGKHYKGMAIQPVQYGTANAYDPCAFSTMKYVSRWRNKNGVEDLDKAAHFVDLRLQMIGTYGPLRKGVTVIQPATFIRENQIEELEGCILDDLHHWVMQDSFQNDQIAAEVIRGQIEELKIIG